MITEDFVSFETAKLLKEKGFDAEGVSEFGGFYVDRFHTGTNLGIVTESTMLNKDLEGWEYLRPTVQMAMKWLRKVYKLQVSPRYDEVEDEKERLHYVWFFDILSTNPYKMLFESEYGYNTYEEAAESAIRYCLENLI